jgi:hypothetical protein
LGLDQPKQPTRKVLQFALPKEAIEAQLETWIAGIAANNEELVVALERLRDMCNAMIVGGTVTNASEVLAQVEVALKNAAKAQTVISRRCRPDMSLISGQNLERIVLGLRKNPLG